MTGVGRFLLSILLAAAPASGQVYTWTDAGGRERTSTRFEDVPSSAYSRLRCRAVARRALTGDRLEVEGGHAIRLLGVDAPDRASAADPRDAARARRRLQALAAGKTLTLRFDANFKDGRWDALAYVEDEAGRDLGERLLAEGLARALIPLPRPRRAERLLAAQAAAKAAGLGVWAAPRADVAKDPGAFRKAFSLGLYAQHPAFDYRPFLRELAARSVTHVMLITPWFLDRHDSLRIRRRPGRSCPMSVVETVIGQARELGMHAAVMPILLLVDSTGEKWRGNIEPRDVDDWFLAYADFLLPFADAGRRAGAELLVVGSELSSMEEHEAHWRAVVADVRRRFGGLLSYSANWDHLDAVAWWDALDLVGMTGYHSLTEKNDPTVAELTARWAEIRDDILATVRPIGRPFFFTEIGYASLDGINKNPWDYVSPKEVDDQEQADCYKAWIRTWSGVRGLFRGAYFYTWWRNQDADDRRQYTVYGKPAERVIRRYFESP